MAGTSWTRGRCTIIEEEALALMEAMKEVASRGINNVIFETDSKIVVDAIQRLHMGTWFTRRQVNMHGCPYAC
ncbi:hypothetical protein L195_g045956 [Trifolium pratense]|uniref:RNase H type-1 domain-containing protein n=1 Tax=Trifolium pratense TaxID=57577 RepID=A0A2K3MGE9_TRIPR|nr:hypothetical protein L195_g045956 [Trifolium pratense]